MKSIGAVAIAFAFVFVSTIAIGATEYPMRPIRIIVPYAAGGTVDVIVRLYSGDLERRLGQPIVVEAKPGAQEIIGTDFVVKAPPDGYTLLAAGNPGAYLMPLTTRQLPFDVERDLTLVGGLSENSYLLAINANLPAKTLQEFIAQAKANPGKLNYSMPGGSFQLDWLIFKKAAGVDLVEIPYKGAVPSIAAVLANDTQAIIGAPGTMKPYVDSGRLRALAALGDSRSPVMPSVPTITEAGLPSFRCTAAIAIFARSLTPRDVIAKLNEELTRISEAAQVRRRLTELGFDPPARMTSEEMNKVARAKVQEYREAARAANIVPQ